MQTDTKEVTTITTWMGQDISKMPREDLEKAFVTLGGLYQDSLTSNIRNMDFLRTGRR